MWIDRLTYSRTTNALALSAQFAEQRHKVLAENLANVDTPDYKTKRLDPQAFRVSLQDALEQTDEKRGVRRLDLRGNAQFATDPSGRVVVEPAIRPAENVLFHDGTNARLEGLLGGIQENALSYQLATNLLRGRYQTTLRAIRGRLT